MASQAAGDSRRATNSRSGKDTGQVGARPIVSWVSCSTLSAACSTTSTHVHNICHESLNHALHHAHPHHTATPLMSQETCHSAMRLSLKIISNQTATAFPLNGECFWRTLAFVFLSSRAQASVRLAMTSRSNSLLPLLNTLSPSCSAHPMDEPKPNIVVTVIGKPGVSSRPITMSRG
jgi:hypothetical protein